AAFRTKDGPPVWSWEEEKPSSAACPLSGRDHSQPGHQGTRLRRGRPVWEPEAAAGEQTGPVL
uniref:Uncharacterized protein n=1 Tax=Fundulus heteroclitus TaxID=8078 RepID=A0A3Q2QYU1_FUNHE